MYVCVSIIPAFFVQLSVKLQGGMVVNWEGHAGAGGGGRERCICFWEGMVDCGGGFHPYLVKLSDL